MKKTPDTNYTRRKFVQNISYTAGLTALSATGLNAFAACGNSSTQAEKDQHIKQEKGKDKLGIALVGLGGYAGGQLAPALLETKNCYLAGIVTGTPAKAEKWKAQYNIPDKNIYNYSSFDTIKNNPDIDIIYVVLPNSMHAEYVVRAAKAGKHVICEKPMAITVEECDTMINACRQAGKMLSIGYRLYFEPYNKEAMRLGQQKVYGAIKKLRADDGFDGAEGWRIEKKLAGGGPLMDVGIYCIRACQYTTGMQPVAVRAQEIPKKHPEKHKDIEEGLTFQLEYANGLVAECRTSYAEDIALLRADAEKGWFQLTSPYGYEGQQGETSDGKMNFPQVYEQALQMDDFALAVKQNRPSPVPGEMGRQDMKVITAIYKAMASGQRVEV